MSQTTMDLAPVADTVAGLRALADMVEQNPDVQPLIRYCLGNMMEPIDTRDELTLLIRAALSVGGKVDKYFSGDKWAGANLCFGPIKIQAFADREQVCEKVVLGTYEVSEEVPDPEAVAAIPKVTVTKTVEEIEWRCHPLLSAVAR